AEAVPATLMQTEMLNRYRDDRERRGIFHVQLAYRWNLGDFSVERLRRALTWAADTPSFRCRFRLCDDGGFSLYWVDGAPLPLTADDWRNVKGDLTTDLQQRIDSDRRRPFLLDAPDQPLWRLQVIRLPEDEVFFLFSMHHAIQDGWTIQRFLRRLIDAYGGDISIDNPPSGPSDIGMAEYALFEAARSREVRSNEWRRALEQHLTDLGLDRWPESSMILARTRAVRQEQAGLSVDSALTSALIQRASASGSTPRAILLWAWSRAIAHWPMVRAERAVPIGVVTNGRHSEMSDPLNAAGMFWYLSPVLVPLATIRSRQDHVLISRQLQGYLNAAEHLGSCPLSGLQSFAGGVLFNATLNYVDYAEIDSRAQTSGSNDLKSVHQSDDFGFAYQLFASMSHQPRPSLWLKLAIVPEALPVGVTADELLERVRQELSALIEEWPLSMPLAIS
ncbi:MAG: condensation domain-containing protein, partial [Xanthomonadaceae bacterium]|nr:condensation domain-containing protein [Xanthomonadaceae bacterium]